MGKTSPPWSAQWPPLAPTRLEGRASGWQTGLRHPGGSSANRGCTEWEWRSAVTRCGASTNPPKSEAGRRLAMGVGGHPVRCAVSTSDQGCQRVHRFNCEPHERLFITAMPPGHQHAGRARAWQPTGWCLRSAPVGASHGCSYQRHHTGDRTHPASTPPWNRPFVADAPPPPPSSVTGPANSVSPCTNATRSTSPVASPSSVTATTGQRMWSTDSTPPYRPKTHHLANTCKSRLRRSPLPYIEVDHWQRQTDCSESGRRSRSSRPVALVQCDAWHRGCHASGPKAKRGSTPKC